MHRRGVLVCFLVLLAAPSRAEMVGCLSDAFSRLIGDKALLSQKHPSLERAGLLTFPGFLGFLRRHAGLCAPTCATYVFDGIDEAVGRAVVEREPTMAGEIKNVMQKTQPGGIKRGMSLEELEDYMRERTAPLGVKVSAVSIADEVHLKAEDLGGPDRVSIISVKFVDPNFESRGAHALVVKAVDLENNEIEVIDPQDPLQNKGAGQLEFKDDLTAIRLRLPKDRLHGEWEIDYGKNTKTFKPFSIYIQGVVRLDFPKGFFQNAP